MGSLRLASCSEERKASLAAALIIQERGQADRICVGANDDLGR